MTNKSWMIKDKVIIPDLNSGISVNDWGDFSVSYREYDLYADLDKIMAYLDGRNPETIELMLLDAIKEQIKLINAGEVAYTDPFESTYFTNIKMYKKGTVHITFARPDLLIAFNQAAANCKNWVGGGY